MRHQAIFSIMPRFAFRRPVPPERAGRTTAGAAALAAGSRWVAAHGRRLLTRSALGTALVLLLLAGGLLLLRTAHAGRVYPAIFVADVPLGGVTRVEAGALLHERADAVAQTTVAFTAGDREWRATMAEIGVTVDTEGALATAYRIGREATAWDRLTTTAGLVHDDARLPLPVRLDHEVLGRWFDRIDRELGLPPHDALLAIDGTSVAIVPEVEGTVVDRGRATATVVAGLRALQGVTAPLPTTAKPTIVRAADLEPARAKLAQALANPVQVTFGEGIWTLPARDLARFVTQEIDPTLRGAPSFSVGLDRAALTAWLEERLAPEINRSPRDAVVGWNGERLVSVEWSIDGAHLEAEPLAEQVEASFFGDHRPVPAPVTITKPTIDSENLDELGIVTLLGRGSSNYSGSSDGRSSNVAVGANLLNGTLVPPYGEFSFNHSIGYITEEKGYVQAQVIVGETIGQDIGGGICQVSTTVFRAAYLAGLPMTEWWPHRFRIPFYEYDGWPPGLDASILQPSEDPSTWGDLRFENPTDSWLLVESWTDGINVVVNIYGADVGWEVVSDGPRYGAKYRVLPDREIVDPALAPGTINLTEVPVVGEEIGHFRSVYDRNGNLLWERNFYTKYYPQGNVWRVSPDMKGKSPADPGRDLPPLPDDPLPGEV